MTTMLSPLAERYLSLLRMTLTDYHRLGPDDGTSFPGPVPHSLAERQALRGEGQDWPLRAESMAGLVRLAQLQSAVVTVVGENVPGDIVETGVWRGGACILARAVLAALDCTDRSVWVADSFAGLPEAEPERYPADAGDAHASVAFLRVDRATVAANFEKYGLLDDQTHFLEGWFEDTLPSAPITAIAVLRLDGDMYSSTWQALEALYDRVSQGGFIIVDDYGAVPGCAKAVDDFRALRGITAPLQPIDWTGRFWRRSDPAPPEVNWDIWTGFANSETADLVAVGEAIMAEDPGGAEAVLRDALAVEPNALPAHLHLAMLALPGPDYLHHLAALHTALAPRCYVEIGIGPGCSLELVRPDCKVVAIDPAPRAENLARLEDLALHLMTSDAFFADSEATASIGPDGFDLGFIDGCHRFEQVLDDFLNLERHAGAGAVIVMHDTLPLDAATSARVRDTTFYSGDAWKAVAVLMDLRPDLRFDTISAHPTGMTIVRGLDPTARVTPETKSALIQAWRDCSWALYLRFRAERLAPVPSLPDSVAGILRSGPVMLPSRMHGTLTPMRDGWIVTGLVRADTGGDVLSLPITVDGAQAATALATAVESGDMGLFEFQLPLSVVWHGPQRRTVGLLDPRTGAVLDEIQTQIVQSRPYRTLQDCMAWLFHHRILSAPFNDADTTCLAYFDWNADRLAQGTMPRGAQPLVSVIMPSHQGAATLRAAIASVQAQTLDDWSLVIIDDGSTDATAAILAEIDDPRVQCLKLAQNNGPALARQLGLAYGASEFVAYLDDDNTWDPRFLAVMTNQLRAAPDWDCAYCGQYLWHPGEDAPFAVRMAPFNPALIDNDNQIDINCLVHRRAAAVACGGFDRNLRRLEDWDFLLRLIAHKPPLFVPVVLSHYRCTPDTPENQARGAAAWCAIVAARDGMPGAFCLAHGARKAVIWAPPPPVQPRARDVTIVIPSFEVPDLLALCVEQVFATIDADAVQVIICDNGSSEATLARIALLKAAHPTLQVDLSAENHGYTHAANRGVRLALPGHDVVLLNNDAIVTDGWLEALVKVAREEPDVGVVAPRQMLLPGTPTYAAHTPIANPHLEVDVSLSLHHANVVPGVPGRQDGLIELNFVTFFCVLLTRRGLDAVGLLEERRGRHYRSDNLYCLALRDIFGMRILYTPRAKVYHLLRQSSRALMASRPVEYREMCLENRWPDAHEPGASA